MQREVKREKRERENTGFVTYSEEMDTAHILTAYARKFRRGLKFKRKFSVQIALWSHEHNSSDEY